VLRKPAARATDTAFGQRICSVAASEMVDHAVDQSASRAGPLLAAVLHAGTRKAEPVLRRDAAVLERIQHFPRYRRVGSDVDNLAGRDHHSQQDRTGLWRRTGAGEFGFVGLGAHRGDRLPLGFGCRWTAVQLRRDHPPAVDVDQTPHRCAQGFR